MGFHIFTADDLKRGKPFWTGITAYENKGFYKHLKIEIMDIEKLAQELEALTADERFALSELLEKKADELSALSELLAKKREAGRSGLTVIEPAKTSEVRSGPTVEQLEEKWIKDFKKECREACHFLDPSDNDTRWRYCGDGLYQQELYVTADDAWTTIGPKVPASHVP